MSNEYRTEIKRFIIRSLEHLERAGRDGINISIQGTDKETGKRFKAEIRIEKNIEEIEDEH